MSKRQTLEERKKDLLGKKFGRLTVQDVIPYINKKGNKKGYSAVCKCACGKETCVRLDSLLRGGSQSCGCLSKEIHYKVNSERMTLWHKEHKKESEDLINKMLESLHKWRAEHPDRVKEIDSLRLEKAHQWLKEHPERIREITEKRTKAFKEWIRKNPEKVKEQRDKAREKAFLWQKENPDRAREIRINNIKKANRWVKDHKKEFLKHFILRRKPQNLKRFSSEEKVIYDYLLSLGYSIERQFLLEDHYFDFRINNFLIEYNGSIYHYTLYENINSPNVKKPPSNEKEVIYHKSLRALAIKNGFCLIQVWDFDWIHKKEFIKTLIKNQLDGTIDYKNYIENGLLNNDYGFNIEGEQIDSQGIWISTTNPKHIVEKDYSKGKVLVFTSGFTKI